MKLTVHNIVRWLENKSFDAKHVCKQMWNKSAL